MATGFHLHRCFEKAETAAERAGPKIKRLINGGKIRGQGVGTIGLREQKSDSSQMQAVRILPQPMEKFLLPIASGRIADPAAMCIVIGEPQ